MPGYEGLYEVSDLGKVRSLDRYVRGRYGLRLSPGRILRQALTGGASPRWCVALHKDGVGTTRLVHHLVLEAFRGARPPGKYGCHGPAGPWENAVWNLAWKTGRDNQGADRVRDGTSNRGERSAVAKLTEAAVMEMRRRYAAGETQATLATEYGLAQNSLSQVITGARWAWLPGAVPIDKARHGKQGEAHHAAKLTHEIVMVCRERYTAGEKQRDLACEFGVTQATMQKALTGVTWR